MVFGDAEASMVNSAFNMTFGPANTVVSLPWVTRLTHFTMDSSIGLPSKMPEIMSHSPSSSVAVADAVFSFVFLDAPVFALAQPRVSVSTASPLTGVEANFAGRTDPFVARQIL